MELKVGYTTDENTKLDKAFTVTDTVTAVIKEDTNIIDPVFILDTPTTAIKRLNYLYVADLGRYYFINDIEMLRGGRVALRCHVDVLKSFASGIRSNTGIIERQGTFPKINKYIDSSIYKCENRNKNQILTFADPESGGFTQHPNYILMVAGG